MDAGKVGKVLYASVGRNGGDGNRSRLFFQRRDFRVAVCILDVQECESAGYGKGRVVAVAAGCARSKRIDGKVSILGAM